MLQVKLPVVDSPTKYQVFFIDMENKVTDDSKFNESPEDPHSIMLHHSHKYSLCSFPRETAEYMYRVHEFGGGRRPPFSNDAW